MATATAFFAYFARSTASDPFARLWVWLVILGVTAGLAMVIRFALHGSRTGRSENWATTEATIFSAHLQGSGALGGFLYSVEFVYSYSIGGEYFTGKTTVPVSHSEKEAQALAARFPSGTEVIGRYFPQKPSESCFRIEDQSPAVATRS